jgi:hypothetical protein
VGCKGKAVKGDLVRVVRAAGDSASVDVAGSAPGRGAYVHRDASCVDAALTHGSVGRALRTGLTPEAAARLRNDLTQLIGAT